MVGRSATTRGSGGGPGCGHHGGHLPGLSVRRIADLAPGSARADAKDAVVIAGAARTLPHTLRSVSTSDEDAAALSMLTGFDPDLARQVNQSEGRIRGQWFTQTSPLSGSGPGGGGGAVVGRTTPHAPSGPMSSPESRPWHQAHPHVPGPDHPCPGSGVPAAAVLAGRDPDQDLQSPGHSWPPTPAWHR